MITFDKIKLGIVDFKYASEISVWFIESHKEETFSGKIIKVDSDKCRIELKIPASVFYEFSCNGFLTEPLKDKCDIILNKGTSTLVLKNCYFYCCELINKNSEMSMIYEIESNLG